MGTLLSETRLEIFFDFVLFSWSIKGLKITSSYLAQNAIMFKKRVQSQTWFPIVLHWAKCPWRQPESILLLRNLRRPSISSDFHGWASKFLREEDRFCLVVPSVFGSLSNGVICWLPYTRCLLQSADHQRSSFKALQCPPVAYEGR